MRHAYSASGRGGFTLIEVAIVATIMAILAGIALPNLKNAVYKADAARVASDVHNIELAIQQFIDDNGGVPRQAPWNTVPPDLAPYLGDTAFRYKTLEYRFLSAQRTGVMRLRVRYPARDPIGAALAQFRRAGEVTWTNRRTDFYLAN